MVKKEKRIRKNVSLSTELANDSIKAIDHHNLDDFNQYVRFLIRRDKKLIGK